MWTLALTFLKRPTVIVILVLVVAMLGMAWRLDSLSAKLDTKETQIEALIKERVQLKAAITACQDDQKLAIEVSNEFQGKLAALNRRMSQLKQLHDNPRCIPVIKSSP